MWNIDNVLLKIQTKLHQFHLKDIYNIDETWIFYWLENYLFATKQLQGCKKVMRELLLLFVAVEMISTKHPFSLLVSMVILNALDVNMCNLSCHYRANKRVWVIEMFS